LRACALSTAALQRMAERATSENIPGRVGAPDAGATVRGGPRRVGVRAARRVASVAAPLGGYRARERCARDGMYERRRRGGGAHEQHAEGALRRACGALRMRRGEGGAAASAGIGV